jgi:hypothetical protein
MTTAYPRGELFVDSPQLSRALHKARDSVGNRRFWHYIDKRTGEENSSRSTLSLP